jgi:hypothetical protein
VDGFSVPGVRVLGFSFARVEGFRWSGIATVCSKLGIPPCTNYPEGVGYVGSSW